MNEIMLALSRRYQQWTNRFPKETQHVYINERNACLGHVGVHEMQYKLNMLDEKIFPLLSDEYIPKVSTGRYTEDPDKIFAKARQQLLPKSTGNRICFSEYFF